MAFRYLIYRTDFGNTIVRESPTDTSTGGTESSLYTDFIIPKTQPLYLWRVTGGTTVIPNIDSNIFAWLEYTAPPITPQDNATVGYVTGITENKIDKLTGATDSIATFLANGNVQDSGYSIADITGSSSGVSYTVFNSYTAATDTRLVNIETDLDTVSGQTDTNTTDIATVSAETANKIDKVTGATGNVGTFLGNGNLEDSGYSISDLTGGTATGGTPIELFTGYTATTDTRLVNIETDLNTVSGQTDTNTTDIAAISAVTTNKLDTSIFNSYTGTTETRLQGIETDIDVISGITEIALTGASNGLTVSGRDVLLGGALTQDTIISGTTFDFTINASDITLQSTGTIDILDTGSNGINIESDAGTIDIIGNDSFSSPITKLTISETQLLVTDDRGIPKGLEYNGDYSLNFTNESLVTKRYVDVVATGLIPKATVQAATTTNIDITGGTFGGTIDGYTVLDGDRILVKDQSLGEQNGIYDYVSSASTFIRSSDFDGTPDGEVTDGNIIPVYTGDTQYNTIWILVTPNPITIGTTELDFTLFSTPHELIPGIGIDISGNTISVDGASLAGNSITWTGDTFNVDVNSGTLATALLSKLDVTDFNSYTGTTETRLNNIEGDITSLSAETATKLDTSIFTGYTATTDTRFIDIESDISSLSGETATKLDTSIFTGYTANTASNEIFLIHTGGTNLNTVIATAIEWNIIEVSGSSYSWTGSSDVTILETGIYELSYNIPYNSDSNNDTAVGANIILNNSSVIDVTAAASWTSRSGAAGNISLPTVIISLTANDVLTLATFRTEADGIVNSSPNGSLLIKKKNTIQ
jgi:hypothetical protein